jgi:hypothetical protein
VTKPTADGSATSVSAPRTVTPLTNDQQYAFIVAGVNAYGEGVESTTVTGTPIAPPGAPSMTVSAPYTAPRRMSLQITAPGTGGPVVSYNVYRGTTSGGQGGTPIATGVTGVSPFGWNDTSSLTTGQTYYYKVSAVNAAGEGTRSTESSATGAVPPKPMLFICQDSEVPLIRDNDQYQLGTGSAYAVQISNVNAVGAVGKRNSGTVTVFSGDGVWGPPGYSDGPFGPLAVPLTITYTGNTYNAWGDSPQADSVSKTLPANLLAPASVTLTKVSGTQVTVTFGLVSGVGGTTPYRVSRSDSASGPWTTTVAWVAGSPYSATSQPVGIWYYSVVGVNTTTGPYTAGNLRVSAGTVTLP